MKSNIRIPNQAVELNGKIFFKNMPLNLIYLNKKSESYGIECTLKEILENGIILDNISCKTSDKEFNDAIFITYDTIKNVGYKELSLEFKLNSLTHR